jgi:hypothetical protein
MRLAAAWGLAEYRESGAQRRRHVSWAVNQARGLVRRKVLSPREETAFTAEDAEFAEEFLVPRPSRCFVG